MTSAGELMSKVYYDPQIKVGMPRQQVLQAAFNILNGIRPKRNRYAAITRSKETGGASGST